MCLLLSFATGIPLAQADRPNVVLIMTDDQGSGDFGVRGNPVIATPNLDAMAQRSASFTNFYVSPVCSPTRASLMTGRYNYRTRVVDTWLGRSMMEPQEVTVAEVLQDAGYATGIFGKWHLGDCYPLRPLDQGFDEALVHRGGGLAQPSEPLENARRYTNPILFRNGQQIQCRGYCTDVYFDAALQFVEQAQASGRNFFVCLTTNAPHGPFHDVPPRLLETYAQRSAELAGLIVGGGNAQKQRQEVDQLARIAAMITNIDENVGRLLARLEAWHLIDNTLIIFLVDNGPNTRRYVGELRGQKGDVYEGGIRSPLWLHWPARLEAGRTADEPAAHIDLMPTILAACAARGPDEVHLDGRNLLPLLEGHDEVTWPQRTLTIQSHRGDQPELFHHFMIREGRWKLLHASGFGNRRWDGQLRFELYDLHHDPGERHNLIDAQPEIAARLKAAYEQWFEDVSHTRPDNFAPPRIHVGTPHENPTVLTRQDWRSRTGWGAADNGQWQLLVAQPGTYDVQVRLEQPAADTTLRLELGNVTRTSAVADDASVDTLRAVQLEAGPATLRIDVTRGDIVRGPYQVVIERIGE